MENKIKKIIEWFKTFDNSNVVIKSENKQFAIKIVVVGVGYYFKIYKKKQEADEDEEEYDEFEDEYEREDDAENLEEKEQQTIDDMAIDSYDEEDEE